MAEPGRKRGAVRRFVDRVAEPYLGDIHGWVRGSHEGLEAAVGRLHGDLGRVHREMEELMGRVKAVERDSARAAAISRQLYDGEPANRRRLHALRREPEYDLAYTEDEPLVTFLVATYMSYETLRDVCLPSILGQTYGNIEVVVVGDTAPPETLAVIEEIGDPRVRFLNLTHRGPYPHEPERRWFVIGSMPYNEALAHARGRWIAGLGDDDAARPDLAEKLLAAARENRYEHCYGLQEVHFPEGEPLVLGSFPPTIGEWGLQGAMFHAGLCFFELELADAIYEEPNDWSFCRRMLRAGVRFGMVDEVVVDKHETRRRSAAAWKAGEVPTIE